MVQTYRLHPASVQGVIRLAPVVPLLVEYSENDDTGCAVGLIVLTFTTVATVLVVRLATLTIQGKGRRGANRLVR